MIPAVSIIFIAFIGSSFAALTSDPTKGESELIKDVGRIKSILAMDVYVELYIFHLNGVTGASEKGLMGITEYQDYKLQRKILTEAFKKNTIEEGAAAAIIATWREKVRAVIGHLLLSENLHSVLLSDQKDQFMDTLWDYNTEVVESIRFDDRILDEYKTDASKCTNEIYRYLDTIKSGNDPEELKVNLLAKMFDKVPSNVQFGMLCLFSAFAQLVWPM